MTMTPDHDAREADRGETAGELDALIVGAGFAGMYQLLRLRRSGLRARALERGPEVGGTWYWNRYPGARCDITSLDYSYSFDEALQQEWEWSEKFATQPEILSYAKHVADRFELRRDIDFGMSASDARWDEDARRWRVTAEPVGGGRPVVHSARYLILAVGNLSSTHVPDLPGLDDFAGRVLHTAEWPHEPVDFGGRRVGVIGTGSSGIQLIPLIAQEAAHLHVFHRTPNYSLPAANRPLTAEETAERKRDYAEYRERAKHSFTGVPMPAATQSVFEVDDHERERVFEEAWASGRHGTLLASFTDLSTDPAANELAAEFVRDKIRAIVEDPAAAEVLAPRGNHFGTKRSCLDTDYYQTFNRDNVALVDLRAEPIERIEPSGLRTSAGEYRFDDLILATGFDAMTGSLLAIDPVGVGGVSLREAWREGPYTYLGVASHGFPNMFMITGPGSPSVLTNMMVSIEQHVDWVTGFIDHLEAEGIDAAQPDEEAQRRWMRTVQDEAAETLYLVGNSWYLGANIPGKPRVFMPYVGGVGRYREIADGVAADGYRGFELARSSDRVAASSR